MTSAIALAPRAVRAPHVSLLERLCRIVLGSPSAAYAFRDMRLQRSLERKGRERAARRAADVPVFEVDRKGWKGAERLPRLWLSEPRFDDATGRCEGRVFVEAYPHDPDPQGWHAYGLARKYFSEGLGYEPSSETAGEAAASEAGLYRIRRLRRDCFRAAEVLYLHALRAGNAAARTGLAELYRSDRCEGSYWSGLLEKRARHRRTIDPRRRALHLFEEAAAEGDAAALLALGEMLAEGEGCSPDAVRALRCFEQAHRRAGAGDDGVRGTAALRLADARANGAGATLDFAAALALYEEATERLQAAFGEGRWSCKRPLVEARLGAARMAQELSGAY